MASIEYWDSFRTVDLKIDRSIFVGLVAFWHLLTLELRALPLLMLRIVTKEESCSAKGVLQALHPTNHRILRSYLRRTVAASASIPFHPLRSSRQVPERAMLRVIGPSSCLREAFYAIFEDELYEVFEIELG